VSTYDLVIRGGSVIDGTGAPARTADVAVTGGRIAAVGRVDDPAARVIDADGALVTPGFVDIHTHYDGQASWESTITPSALHGVTTVVMSNCGVGFAPVRASDHDRLIELMEGVEDIPGAALHEGLSWTWESYAEYLAAVDRPHDVDVAGQVPHGPIRLYVMGERGAQREPATADEIAEMGRLAAGAVEAGALGFTTSRTLNHRTSRGEPTPTLTAAREELVGIAAAVGRTGAGVLQVITDFPDFDEEMETLRAMVAVSGRPLSVSLSQIHQRPDHFRQVLAAIGEANADGLTMRAQVAPRAIGILLGLQATINPLGGCPSYQPYAGLPVEEQAAGLSQPDVRAAVIDEYEHSGRRIAAALDRVFVLADPPDYEPGPDGSVAALAARLGVPPAELVVDLLLAEEGRALLYMPIFNYAAGNLDAVAEMLADPHTVPGLGDGGAHAGTICDASFPTTLIAHWGRDRKRGPTFDLPWLVRRQTHDTAAAVGLLDRGVIAPGYKADLNVIDFDRLGMAPPHMVHDLPAGGKRLVQAGRGYVHTLVSGQPVHHDGEATGALPGALVRGPQPAPAMFPGSTARG
jgi:N-acyl-D-aspartate/D-glutamate deacylase